MNLKSWINKNSDIGARQAAMQLVADAIGVSLSLIKSYISGARRVTAENVIPIAEATNFEVTPHELRPDIYPYPSDGIPPNLITPKPESADADVAASPGSGSPEVGEPASGEAA